MIDRTYLPYKSARDYRDRGMAKWMGFFLSEHQSALKASQVDLPTYTPLPLEEKLLLLSQAYVNQLYLMIQYKEDDKIQILEGQVIELAQDICICRSLEGDYRLNLAQIIRLHWEEGWHECENLS